MAHRFRPLLARGVLAGTLVIGVAACGGDDDEGSPAAAPDTSTTEGGESAPASGATVSTAFCDGVASFNDAVNTVDISPETPSEEVSALGQQLMEAWEPVRNNAPDSVSSEVASLSAVLEPMAQGDAEAFNADETFESYLGFLGTAIDECEFETTTVTAVDYAFEGVPETMSTGTVAVELTNVSDAEMHELVVFRKNNPGQATDEIFGLPDDQAESAITFVGAAFALPGESSSALISLEEAGDYVAVCFIPVGASPDDQPEDEGGPAGGPPHFTQGMVAEFTVE